MAPDTNNLPMRRRTVRNIARLACCLGLTPDVLSAQRQCRVDPTAEDLLRAWALLDSAERRARVLRSIYAEIAGQRFHI